MAEDGSLLAASSSSIHVATEWVSGISALVAEYGVLSDIFASEQLSSMQVDGDDRFLYVTLLCLGNSQRVYLLLAADKSVSRSLFDTLSSRITTDFQNSLGALMSAAPRECGIRS